MDIAKLVLRNRFFATNFDFLNPITCAIRCDRP